jgi:hypothetical protein
VTTTRSTIVAALAAALVAIAVSWAFRPIERGVHFDNQIYFFMAERSASGEPPHVSLVDHKHQVSTILSGWAIQVGRAVGVEDVFAARALSIAVAVSVPATVAFAAASIWGTPVAAWVAGAVMVSFPDFYFQGVVGFRPKVFMAAFLAMALLAHARGFVLVAGLFAGASFHCWQPALLASAAIGASFLIIRRWRDAVVFSAGFLIFTSFYEGWFWAHGALGEQLFQSYRMPADVGGYRYPSFEHGMKFFTSMGLWRQSGQAFWGVGFIAMAVALPLIALLGPRATYRRVLEQPALAAWAMLSVVAVAMTFLDHQGYPDLFFLHPLMAIGFAGMFAAMIRRMPGGWATRALITALLCAGIVDNGLGRFKMFGPARDGLARQKEHASLIGLLEEEYGPVWAIGCPHLLALERRPNFSQFGMLVDPKVRHYAATKAGPSGFDPTRNGLRPGALIVSRGGERAAMPRFDAYYERFPVAELNKDGIHVWVARDGRRRPSVYMAPPPKPKKAKKP